MALKRVTKVVLWLSQGEKGQERQGLSYRDWETLLLS